MECLLSLVARGVPTSPMAAMFGSPSCPAGVCVLRVAITIFHHTPKFKYTEYIYILLLPLLKQMTRDLMH